MMNDKIRSKFLMPFWCEKPDFNNEFWTENKEVSKHLLKYISELFDSSNEIYRRYTLRDDRYEFFGLPQSSHMFRVSDSRQQTYDIRIAALEIVYFASKIGFLVLNIEYCENKLISACDVSYALSHLFSENTGWRYSSEAAEIDLAGILRKIIQSVAKKKGELFPGSEDKQAYTFHVGYSSVKHVRDTRCIYGMIKGTGSDMSANISEKTFSEKIWYLSKEQLCGIDSNGVIFYSYENERNNVISESVSSVNEFYLLYLWILHQRETLLKYNYEVVRNWKQSTRLIKLREQLIRFSPWFSYSTVSVNPVYQQYYERVYEAYGLTKLQGDVSEVVDKVDEFVSAKKERRISNLLSSIALLAVISAVNDVWGIVDRVLGIESQALINPHIYSLAIVGACILIIWKIFSKK